MPALHHVCELELVLIVLNPAANLRGVHFEYPSIGVLISHGPWRWADQARPTSVGYAYQSKSYTTSWRGETMMERNKKDYIIYFLEMRVHAYHVRKGILQKVTRRGRTQ
jgi:hypothetical protein